MACAMVLTLACAALAAGARYVDYSAVRVPEYGGVAADYDGPRDLPASSDEYRDNAPDSSASLDYKYEQPPRRSDKSRSKEMLQSNVEDADNWQIREKKQKKKSNDDANLETLDKYSPHEMVPKFHPSDRLSIRPNHVKLRKTEREIKLPHTRNTKLKNRKDELQDDFDSEGNFDLHDDYVYDKRSNVGIRATTTKAKKARRKPRDRYVKSRQLDESIEEDQDIVENPETITKKTYQEYFDDRKDIDPSMQRRLDTDDEDKLKDYSNLMGKRQFYPVPMENKKKDPTNILSDTDTEFNRRMEPFDLSGKILDTVDPEARTGMLSGGRRFSGLKSEGRRKDVALGPPLRLSDEEGKRVNFRSKNIEQQEYDNDENYYDMKRVQNNIKSKLPSLVRRTSKERTRATQRWRSSTSDLVWKNRRVFVPDPEKRDSTNTTTTTTTSTSTYITTTVTPTVTTSITIRTSLSKEELSLAEKSRLSILKKALRKENSVNVVTTQKPPVLMQMAANMQTLAIVEPASSQEPIFRATEVFDDNPSQLDKVKRLMRHKLVANAKDIRDLTDNWDDVVCVDTSPPPAPQASVAERELTALLVARRNAPPFNDTGAGASLDDAATTTPISCTFAPHAVDPKIDTEWTKFVKTNGVLESCG